MYESFFGLRKNPFIMSPDPGFLFLTESHREALAGLTYALTARKGFVVLTGDAGTGKTTLLSTILASMPSQRVRFSFVLNPTLTPAEFLELTLLDFGISDVPASKAKRLMRLQQFLVDTHACGKIAVLIVDEAHKLSPEVLEEVRLLTNFETPAGKMLQIVLAGQSELSEVLNRPDLRQLKQRIAVRLNIDPLSDTEVDCYMRHRWTKAEAATQLPFGAEAIRRIARWSHGIPRVVNSICDNALLLAFSSGTTQIGADHVLEVVADLDLADRPSGNGKGSGPKPALPPVSSPVSSPNELRIPAPLPRPPEATPFRTLERYAPATKPSLLARWAGKLGLVQ